MVLTSASAPRCSPLLPLPTALHSFSLIVCAVAFLCFAIYFFISAIAVLISFFFFLASTLAVVVKLELLSTVSIVLCLTGRTVLSISDGFLR